MKFIDLLYIELARFIRSSPYDVIIQNFMEYPYECDMLRFKDSGTVYEYEIKTSKADYLADFKKSFYDKSKHEELRAGKLLPNYFLFVLPKGMVPKEDIPAHCGLIEYTYYPPSAFGTGHIFVRLTKSPKRLHNNRFDDWHKIAKRLAFRDNENRKTAFYKARNWKQNEIQGIPSFVTKNHQ